MADATTGPGLAGLETPVSAVLPAAAGNRPLVQVRILTTNAIGQDEWVGLDDIEVEPSGYLSTPPGPGPMPPGPLPPGAGAPPSPGPGAPPPLLTGLTISPAAFKAAKRGAAVTRTGRIGASLRFRLSRPVKVEFRVTSPRTRA